MPPGESAPIVGDIVELKDVSEKSLMHFALFSLTTVNITMKDQLEKQGVHDVLNDVIRILSDKKSSSDGNGSSEVRCISFGREIAYEKEIPCSNGRLFVVYDSEYVLPSNLIYTEYGVDGKGQELQIFYSNGSAVSASKSITAEVGEIDLRPAYYPKSSSEKKLE